MAGHNQKTSLDPAVAFYGDLRFRSDARREKNHKIKSARKVWDTACPGVAWPHYPGSAYHAYDKLGEAGWVYSTLHGWRKAEPVSIGIERPECCICGLGLSGGLDTFGDVHRPKCERCYYDYD